MSSSTGGLGLEKNAFTHSSSGAYFTSCESNFPLKTGKLWVLPKLGDAVFLTSGRKIEIRFFFVLDALTRVFKQHGLGVSATA